MSNAKTADRAPRPHWPRLSPGAVRRRARQGAAVLLCAGFAAGHAALLIWTEYKGIQSGIINWPVLLAPALLTLIVLPSSRRHWRRWALSYFIVFICNPVLLPQVIVITEAVVLYSIWVRDRPAGDLEWARRVAWCVILRMCCRAGSGTPGTAPGQARKTGSSQGAKASPAPKCRGRRPDRVHSKAQ